MKETKNKYNCSPRMWAKFTEPQKRVFNVFYKDFFDGGNNYYPNKVQMDKEELQIACHNLACLVAMNFGTNLKEIFHKS
jgi:hypothetical protein